MQSHDNKRDVCSLGWICEGKHDYSLHPPTGYFRLLIYKPPKHQTMRKIKGHNSHIIAGKLMKPTLLKSQHN